MSRGALRARAISAATGTPPRGNASTTGAASFFFASTCASARPAARRSANVAPIGMLLLGALQVSHEPSRCQRNDLIERPRLFKQVRRARRNLEMRRTGELSHGAPVELDDHLIVLADDQ